MTFRLLLSLLLAHVALAADRITICGWDEIYQIDPAAEKPVKLWSWRAKDRPEIPEALKGTFNTTDECKPLEGGKQLLVCSSGGGCALLEMPSGKPLWWARVTNAHSIEALPKGLIAVASSTGATGDRVVLFDSKVPEKELSSIPLHSGHGVVWDEARRCLWALGYQELLACTLVFEPSLALEVKAKYKVPDKGGHDLRAIPGSPDLVLSSHSHVWRFDREKKAFRPDPDLKDRVKTKCVDVHPENGRVIVTQAKGENWWTDFVELRNPAGRIELPGERIYKARWFPAE